MVPPTFEELKTYCSDPDAGLGRDMVARISSALGLSSVQIKEKWEGRFVQTAVLKDGVLTKTPIYTRLNKAYFDKGTWLRNATGSTGTTRNRTQQGGTAGGSTRQRIRNLVNGQQQTQQEQQDKLKEMFPEFSDDPEVWWKVQSEECKQKILRAFAAEKIYRVKELQGKVCPECGGKGSIVSPAQNDGVICPMCRGLTTLVVVLYE
jgi:hypothetical protein